MALWQEVKGKQTLFTVPRPVKKVARKRKKIPPSEWAPQHRPITVGPLAGTRYKKETVPYANGIMDASVHNAVEEIVLCCADQVSKSFIMETLIGYMADRMPGPVAYTYPDEDTTKDNIKDRLLPMFRDSPRLKTYLTGSRDDESKSRINLTHMPIYATWAGSPTKLANKSIKYIIADEVDKFPDTAGKKEGAPLDKLRKRFRTYNYGRKMWISSTPTIDTGAIWVELNDCNIVFEYHVVCPDCGHEQPMVFEQIKWPEDMRDPALVLDSKNQVHYVCPHCGSCWGEAKRNAAVRWGKWRAMKKSPDGEKEYIDAQASGSTPGQVGMEMFEYLDKHKPRKIGFHIPSWLSRFVKLKEVAAAFLASIKNKIKLKDFNNSHAAKPWTDFTQERQEDVILKLRDDRPRGIVPGGDKVCCLTAGIDTHGLDDRGWFAYEIRAWGWGNTDKLLPESWQIREGFIAGATDIDKSTLVPGQEVMPGGFAALEQILWNTKYYDSEGKEYFVLLALQDAMGRRTSEVYNFCIKHRYRIYPTQGVDSTRMSQPHSFSDLEYYPGTKTKIPGGVRLYRFNNKFYKDILDGKLSTNIADPYAWFLHNETTKEWARQLCSEVVDEKSQQWVKVTSNAANHGWDCSVLNILAAEILGVKYQVKQARQRPEVRSQRPGGVAKSNFMSRG